MERRPDMSRSPDIKALKEIAKIREAQQTAAALEVAIADVEVRRLDDLVEETALRLRDEESNWSRALRRPLLQLDIVRSWSSVLLGRQEELQSAEFHRDEALSHKAHKAQAWKGAQARQDCAQAISTAAERIHRRRHEERATAWSADAFLHRKARP